ncbi:hypothetical protein [Bosea sp. TAF32]|uniref:hypothetical protein n=1 Tax=Bosea sp. TAF32 TaxID=3237482 RepID=UPI003F905F70
MANSSFYGNNPSVSDLKTAIDLLAEVNAAKVSATASAASADADAMAALASQNAAAASALAAFNSESSAANSAATATTKASEASTSATNAANSASAALASKNAAAVSETNAAASASSVLASQNAAAASAAAALALKNAAATSEANAWTNQQNAAANEANSYTNRLAAEAAKAAAETARDWSAGHANNANNYKDAALNYRNDAETARTGAEAAKAGAETHQGYAWGYAQEALGYRDTTLAYRDDAENFKNLAALSAAAAASFDPSSYYTKAQSDVRFAPGDAPYKLKTASQVHGGGIISVSNDYRVKWSARFITIANGGATWVDINCPTSGTVITCTDGTTVTADANGIPLEDWASIWFDPSLFYANGGGLAHGIRIVRHNHGAAYPMPDWVPLCHKNGDNAVLYFPRGIALKQNQSRDTGKMDWHEGNFDPNTKASLWATVNFESVGASSFTMSGADSAFNLHSREGGGSLFANYTYGNALRWYRAGFSGKANKDVAWLSNDGHFGIDGNFYADMGTKIVWHAGNFDPATKANISHTHVIGDVTNLQSTLDAKITKTGDTMTGDLTINKANPILNFYWGGVKHTQIWLDASGTFIVRDGGGQNHFYVTPGGAIWTQQLGDLNTRIEDRANAWSAARRDEANNYAASLHSSQQSDVNDRIHRIRMVGYGEYGGTGGMGSVAPGVFTGASGTLYGAQTFAYRTLQQHIPAWGGWVNCFVE